MEISFLKPNPKKIDFSFDLKTGLELITNNDYEYYFFDIDVPKEISEDYKLEIQEYINSGFEKNYKNRFLERDASGFILIDKLLDKNKKIVVYSGAGHFAAGPCYSLNIPFYSKSHPSNI